MKYTLNVSKFKTAKLLAVKNTDKEHGGGLVVITVSKPEN